MLNELNQGFFSECIGLAMTTDLEEKGHGKGKGLNPVPWEIE
jgi:hypothetical protein